MEVVDAALADARFAALLPKADADGRGNEYVLYDSEREAWVVGVCGPKAGKRSYWRAVVVGPITGDASEIVRGPSGKHCAEGP
jgi:hypothetical protein